MRGIKRTLKERIAHLRLLAGDTDAFGYFYDQYATRIYRFIFFKTSDKEVAQDITHDVFLDVWEYIVDRKAIDNVQAYVYKVARNKVVDYYRSRGKQPMLLKDYVAEVADQGQVEAAAELRILMKHLRNIKEEYQEIIILRHVEGLTIDEISQILEKDKNNIRVTLHRATNQLKDHYNGNASQTSKN